jgi:hypothetical protein
VDEPDPATSMGPKGPASIPTMLPLLAAAWAVGTAKLIAENALTVMTVAIAGNHTFFFEKYDTLASLMQHELDREPVANSHAPRKCRQGG